VALLLFHLLVLHLLAHHHLLVVLLPRLEVHHLHPAHLVLLHLELVRS
jgi:hypothetical protein